MTFLELRDKFSNIVVTHPDNSISEEYALSPELVGIKLYDEPLVGCASANDPIFQQIKEDPLIHGPMLKLPEEWLPGAKSIISFFLPFTKEIRESNIDNLSAPSNHWLHGRIEGQAYLMQLCSIIANWLNEDGYEVVIPAGHPDFIFKHEPERQEKGEPAYTSPWSERHAAFAAGLGTFSLSRNLITEKGVCGRFGSIITNAPLEITPRPYTDPFEYCLFCGACAPRCPVSAISAECKDINICGEFTFGTKKMYAPRYGCGKCQVDVPCETGIPGR